MIGKNYWKIIIEKNIIEKNSTEKLIKKVVWKKIERKITIYEQIYSRIAKKTKWILDRVDWSIQTFELVFEIGT